MDANATITNTMIVVIVVSRRVGQVTLAVSERTSCRNLNGLKAIAVPGPDGDECHVKRETGRSRLAQALCGPTLCSRRRSRKAGSIVRGFQLPRRISAFKRAGCRWRLSTAGRSKGQGRGCKIKDLAGGEPGRSGRARTCDPRFWR